MLMNRISCKLVAGLWPAVKIAYFALSPLCSSPIIGTGTIFKSMHAPRSFFSEEARAHALWLLGDASNKFLGCVLDAHVCFCVACGAGAVFGATAEPGGVPAGRPPPPTPVNFLEPPVQ